MNVETENQDKGVHDWMDGKIEVSYEDYGDFEGSYEDYGVIPEGYGEPIEDPVEKSTHPALLENQSIEDSVEKSTHVALVEDQTRTKTFAKHNWIKVVR